MKATHWRTLIAITSLFFISNFINAQNGREIASLNTVEKPTRIQEISEDLEFPEEQEEVLSELEIMILKEIGKAMSFEDRKSTIFNLIAEAKTYIGTPYVYGGTTRSGIDCSAFMQSVFAENEISLPRVSRNQALVGEKIPYEDIEMGDMIFFSNSPKSRISHVGMVVEVTKDDILFIHAGSSTGVTISPLSMNYWTKRFRYAKRVFGKAPKEFYVNQL